ncbi:MAG: maleylpyruvate isomerase family mycothiol-dependent enzyme [Pseudonocardiaceae bacterium]
MAQLPHDRYLDTLTTQSALFAAALPGADPQLPVPTCPGWTLHRLTEHLGQVHRWTTAIVTRRATAPLDPGALGLAGAPEDPDGLGAWLREGATALADAMRAAGSQTPVWSFADDHSVGFWARRQAHETAVHRADAELALGRAFALDAELAADAISEWLSLLCLPQAVEMRPELDALLGAGQVLHLHATDPGLGEAGEWTVRRTPSGLVWEPGHAEGDVAGQGAAADLLLVLMRRVPPAEAPITVLGDATVLEYWLEHTRF